MKHIALTLLVIFVAAIVGISMYLSPDNLRSCRHEPTTTGVCQKVDAVIAISGGNTALRTAEAVKLYKNGWARYIIVSGAAADVESPSNAAVMRLQALRAGVPDNAIIIEEYGRTTKQNATNIDDIVRNFDINRVIVVTSPYHQRRAGLEFKAALNNVTVLNHPAAADPDWPWYWWLTPRGWWLAISELVKIGAVSAGESQ